MKNYEDAMDNWTKTIKETNEREMARTRTSKTALA